MKTLKWLEENFEGMIMAIMLIALTFLVMLQVVMRYLVNDPLTWSEELCRMLLVWSGFFSIGFCARKDTTIRLDTILNILPVPVRRVVWNVTTVFMIALLGWLLKGAYELVMDTYSGGSLLPGLLIPQYWLYVGPLVGIALGMLRFIQCLFRTHFYRNIGEKKEG